METLAFSNITSQKMFKNTLYSSANNSIACSAAMAMAVHTVRTVSEHSARQQSRGSGTAFSTHGWLGWKTN